MASRLREEFDRSALTYLAELARVASRLCGSRDAADDLVQETYLQAWRSFHRFEPGTNCRAWLYKILLFSHARQQRRQTRRPMMVALDAAAEAAFTADASTPDTLTASSVKAAFESLPEAYRVAVMLVDVEEFSYREAALALDVPIGTVMSRLNRGRRLLRVELAKQAAASGSQRMASQWERRGSIVTRECQHIRDLLDSYLSGELLIETNHLVLRHLETCSDCRTEFVRRQRTRALLAQSLGGPVDVEPLRRRIAGALDREQRRGSRVVRYWGTAAVIAAGLVISFWFSRRVDAAAYRDSVTEHVQCGLTVPSSATYDPKRIAARLKPPFTPMAEAVARTSGKYILVDAHTCPLNGRQYAHLVYRGDGRVLSVFAEPALRGALPAAPSKTLLEGTSIDMYGNVLDGYRVTATSTHDHHIFVVTDDTSAAGVPADLLKSAISFVRTLEK